MTTVGLISGEEFLLNAAQKLFEDRYEKPKMHFNEQLHRDLPWTPALRFTIHESINIFVEPSETEPYPRILKLKKDDVYRFSQPIAIYSVCPEDMISKSAQRSERNLLQDQGFGLITVDPNGHARSMFSAIPLIQVISQADFKKEIHGLSHKIRQRVSEAFDDYCNKPVNGVKSLSEVIEGLVTQAGNDVVRKGCLSKKQLGSGVAEALDALYNVQQYKNIRAAIGGARSHISVYRNLSHHWPKNKRKAHEKYGNCRHAFLDGIKQIQQFREAMKSVGLSGNLPNTKRRAL